MADWSIDPHVSLAPTRLAGFDVAGIDGKSEVTGVVQGTGPGTRQVGPEIVVTLEYALYDVEGALVEAPGSDEPIEFIFGVGQASPAIERAVEGASVDQSRRIRLEPSEAFGARDDSAVLVVDRSELPEGAALGDEFEAESEDGEAVFLRVVELDDDVARLDANHPLAGQTVTLELRVVALRIASSAELAVAEAELAARREGVEPDVLASRLLKRQRFTPPTG